MFPLRQGKYWLIFLFRKYLLDDLHNPIDFFLEKFDHRMNFGIMSIGMLCAVRMAR